MLFRRHETNNPADQTQQTVEDLPNNRFLKHALWTCPVTVHPFSKVNLGKTRALGIPACLACHGMTMIIVRGK